ncbi:hypothetical protein PC119_g28584 [Phytophthora cactorum]|uniref:Reverse transcriptase Ty1/copia-type domain-containing protein n=1 Tax=Phytophthora cactorum TaxID=29920 RepID=A0A8T0XUZ0_9STRA|nr:hypothetical protein PC113_g25823 [Phytophthora cactorum]KAG2945924.1 hypothetical protein PC119_g28584 [Phytophthora cactorum]
MLHHAKLDKRFWAEAAMTAIYVKNRLPSPKIEHKTPFEIVYKSKPSVDGRYGSWTRSLYEAEGGTSQTVGPERRHLRGRMKIRK